jgi:hypothetical protein
MAGKSTEAQRSRDAWEKHWGKKVPRGYIVHHKDGDPKNIAPSNLRIVTLAEHNTLTKKGKTLKQQEHQAKNKPNIAGKEKPQRRYRHGL